MVFKCYNEEDGVILVYYELFLFFGGILCFIKFLKCSLMRIVVIIGWVRIFCYRCRIGLELGSKMSGNLYLL